MMKGMGGLRPDAKWTARRKGVCYAARSATHDGFQSRGKQPGRLMGLIDGT